MLGKRWDVPEVRDHIGINVNPGSDSDSDSDWE
jgi:hypothetical protein